MKEERKEEIKKLLTEKFQETLDYFLLDPSFWWGEFFTDEEINFISEELAIDLKNKKIVLKED